MRPRHLPDEQLTPDVVPPVDAPAEELLAFGHRYHAYRTAGSLPRVAAIAVEVHDRWSDEHDEDPAAELDEPLQRLRVALFHTARAASQGRPDGGVDADTLVWLRVLVRSVSRQLADERRG